jgi:hypothetical protein
LRLAAPYLAVAVFWCIFQHAWLAILSYHAQILWWRRGTRPALARPRWNPAAFFILPFALAGPLLVFLLPRVARTDPGAWLDRHHLSGPALVAMIFYFGLVHPVLEQMHWAPLRERTALAHTAFAGYHLLVLYSLLSVPWLVASFAVLWLVSWSWKRMMGTSGSLWPAIAAQALADLGLVLFAAIRFIG